MHQPNPHRGASSQDDLGSLSRDGWRLERLELLNWGTFHKKVWSLAPSGSWSLLVGENGSGKTTAVDGLRTLLVPPRLLNYNDASGGQAKRDRSRVSYIRGAWAAAATEESHLARTQYLRSPGELSHILAVFRREGTEKVVTLAQILWVSDDQPDELFLVAESERSIRGDLSELKGAKRELRTELRKRGWEVHEAFSAYAARFRPLLGIPNEGALEIFNQAIGVKEVDDINRFVRRHLIEKGDALVFVRETLAPLFRELLACWQKIQKAEEQIGKLKPVAEAQGKAETARERLKETKALLDVMRPYFLDAERSLRNQFADDLAERQRELEDAKRRGNADQDDDNQARDRLRGEMDSGAVGTRLREIEVDIKANQIDVKDREGRLKSIAPALKLLGHPAQFANADELNVVQRMLRDEQLGVQRDLENEQQKHIASMHEQQKLEVERKRVTASLAALKHHQVNIDEDYLNARAQIAQSANIAVAQLPFAGELVEVHEKFREWTGAIERLLRGFGLSLLVHERHYQHVSRIINKTHWGLRLQFFRIGADFRSDMPTLASPATFVVDRLSFRLDHPLSGWVATEIKRAFPHTCCDDENQLSLIRYGITREGLVRNGDRHVKDDRRHVGDATQFVLGWSLETKRLALTARLRTLENEVSEAKSAIAAGQSRLSRLSEKLSAIAAVLAIPSFEAVNLARDRPRGALGGIR